MTRLIKRYGSRKLYDTKESRYVSLEDIAAWVRDGEDIQVLDNATSEDVTVATLTQVISEEGRKGHSVLPSDLLHDLIRVGGNAVTDRVKKFQDGVEGFFKKSIDRLVPVSKVRSEMEHLRERLTELEAALDAAEHQVPATAAEKKESESKPAEKKTASKATATKSTAAKSTATKSTAKTGTRAKKTTTGSKRTTRKTTASDKETAAATETSES